MSQRFFVDQPIADQTLVTLSGPEAHHLARVMRGQVGDEVVLFDGCGREYRAKIEQLGRRDVELTITECSELESPSERPLTLAVALPKGDRQKWLVEKAVELGVARLQPLHTERSVAKTNSAVIDRLRRAAVEASKQCGRNWLMEILPPAEFSVWLNPTGYDQRWLAHPTGGRPLERGQRVPGAATIGVGPEGGFSDGEVTMATEAGCRLLSLGRHTLRVETAALAAAAQWEQWE